MKQSILTDLLTLADALPPHLAVICKQACALLQAAESEHMPQVDELASLMRSKLPGLDFDESIVLATDLLGKYGQDTDLAQAAMPVNNRERKQGPNPGTSNMYAPGKADWWTS